MSVRHKILRPTVLASENGLEFDVQQCGRATWRMDGGADITDRHGPESTVGVLSIPVH